MLCHMYKQISLNWNMKSMNSMSILLILLIKLILFQSHLILIHGDELNLNSNNPNHNNNPLTIQNDQQRAQALAKLMSLFYTSDAFNKYMENLDAYYMLRGRPRFGKRNSNHNKENTDLIHNYLREKFIQKYLIENFLKDTTNENEIRNEY
ncbi:unnamed protein product [Schistosoma spindalis]|nr:unnamed protein product [Schistosoma spindale]